MKHCATCKHWGDDVDAQRAQPGEPRDCNRINHRDYRNELRVLAYTVDASDYHSALITYAEFGCVLHAPRTLEQIGETQVGTPVVALRSKP